MKPTSTLIISTYNWPEALELVLLSVKNQVVYPKEVIIADDGSDAETKKLIARFQINFPVPLIHIWHLDEGFRKAVILNKAIAKAKGDYIVQIDGDCIVHPKFVADHLKRAEPDTYLYGCRVSIKKSYLKTLFNRKQIQFTIFSSGIKKRTRALHIPLFSDFYKASPEFSRKYRGCNTSFFKKNAIAVNGYNEDFKGWGREDTEFAMRLGNKGVNAKRIRYRGIVYHIFHKEKSKNRLVINHEMEQNTKHNKKVIWCENGIDKYLEEKK